MLNSVQFINHIIIVYCWNSSTIYNYILCKLCFSLYVRKSGEIIRFLLSEQVWNVSYKYFCIFHWLIQYSITMAYKSRDTTLFATGIKWEIFKERNWPKTKKYFQNNYSITSYTRSSVHLNNITGTKKKVFIESPLLDFTTVPSSFICTCAHLHVCLVPIVTLIMHKT